MSRKTTEELQRARLELNTPDGFAISKAVIRELIDEVLELRGVVQRLKEGEPDLLAAYYEESP